MVKLIALYKRPEDEQAFDKHYREIHTPLAMKMPGLQRFELTRIVSDPMGKPGAYYLMAELYFESMEALQASMQSPEGMAAAKDVMGFAGQLVTMMIGQTEG